MIVSYSRVNFVRSFSLAVVCLCLITFPPLSGASDNQFSPGVYEHVPFARSQVKGFLNCHSSAARQVVNQMEYELKRQLFGEKTGNILVALPGWFEGFTDPVFSQVFRLLISGEEVRNIKQKYNQVMNQARGASKISKLLFLMEINDKPMNCSANYLEMHKRVADQYDIAMAWLDLVNLYIGINNDYRAFLRQGNKLNEKFRYYKRTRDQLHKIENY